MNRYDISERFAKMWKQSRETANKSQDYMAKHLGVSRKTVQNWEDGTSCPNQITGFEWFCALDLQPLPFYLNLLYPDAFAGLTSESSDKDIEKALMLVVKNLPSDSKRKLLYLLTGEHGSSPLAMIELVVAHLHTDLRARLSIARSVINNFEVAQETGGIVRPDHIMPNMDLLREATEKGKHAVVNGKQTYTSIL